MKSQPFLHNCCWLFSLPQRDQTRESLLEKRLWINAIRWNRLIFRQLDIFYRIWCLGTSLLTSFVWAKIFFLYMFDMISSFVIHSIIELVAFNTPADCWTFTFDWRKHVYQKSQWSSAKIERTTKEKQTDHDDWPEWETNWICFGMPKIPRTTIRSSYVNRRKRQHQTHIYSEFIRHRIAPLLIKSIVTRSQWVPGTQE